MCAGRKRGDQAGCAYTLGQAVEGISQVIRIPVCGYWQCLITLFILGQEWNAITNSQSTCVEELDCDYPLKYSILKWENNDKKKGESGQKDLQDGRGIRRWDHLPAHKYIKNTNTCGTTPTEHLLNTVRRPQTSQKGLGAPAGCQAWALGVGELSSGHWTTKDLPVPCNINQQQPSQRSLSQR